MTKQEKQTLVQELSKKLAKTNYFYITDSEGMNAVEMNDFRRTCFEEGVEYKMFKNVIIRKALEKLDTDYSSFFNNVLKGNSGIMFASEVGNKPARILKIFKKQNPKLEKPVLKGASIDSNLFIGTHHLEMLSNLKSKEDIIGDIIILLQSPAKNIVSMLKSGGSILMGLIKTLSERET